MGWNDHSPHFERIEALVEEILDEAWNEGENLTYEQAYEKACEEYTNDMRDVRYVYPV